MELQLSLALPIHTPTNGFDLNRKLEFEPENLLSSFGCCKEINNHFKRKRGNFPLEAAFGQGEGISTTETFPLVSWNDDPNEEDDSEENERKKRNTDSGHGDYRETSFLVGWPPINPWRKKQIHGHQGGGVADDHRMVERRGGGRTNSVFVKVKMEGVAIGRKIDLNLYHSYQMLRITLIDMFAKYQEDEKDGAGYTLLYQDREGNWLLAGEVPWQTFIESVQRMEVVRNEGVSS